MRVVLKFARVTMMETSQLHSVTAQMPGDLLNRTKPHTCKSMSNEFAKKFYEMQLLMYIAYCMTLTYCRKSQVSADGSGIVNVPIFITDKAPFIVTLANFNTTLIF